METYFESGIGTEIKMPCQNQQLNNNDRQEHAAMSSTKQVRFASCGNSVLTESNRDAEVAETCENVFNSELQRQIGSQLKLLPLNDQIRELQTIIRDKSTSRGDFVFCADRLIRLVVEEGLNQLPYSECTVTTPTGEAMEQGLRDCCRSIRIGKILIQSDEDTQKAKVYYAKFPPDISRRKVLLMYPILSTGNTVIEAVRVLTEHGLQPKHIILLSLFSTPHGAKSIIQEFPEITILTTEVHPVAPTHFGQRYFGTD
uniref:Uracil phosphoribosyltransferase homolog n=1 Tax=Salmo trutta TaxID=8032 RepID=A0A674BHY2_SALTR